WAERPLNSGIDSSVSNTAVKSSNSAFQVSGMSNVRCPSPSSTALVTFSAGLGATDTVSVSATGPSEILAHPAQISTPSRHVLLKKNPAEGVDDITIRYAKPPFLTRFRGLLSL